MSDANPTERMHQLWTSVQQALRDLDAGKLDLDGLERASADAQALYERLIILRHKAREGKHTVAGAASPVDGPPPVTAPAELPNMRLDTRPTDIPPRQTSLIDAIAETETPPPAKPSPPEHVRGASTPPARPPRTNDKPAVKGPSLGDKLEKAPINDLHKAIALSQKFWFVAELFGGQRERYEKAVDTINTIGSIEEARAFMAKEIVAKAARPPAEDALQAFTELVDRRFK
jgi:hypothetical protein